MTFEEAVELGAAELGIALRSGATEKFRAFFDLVREAARRFNLTGITEAEEAAVKHFLDSLAVLRWVQLGVDESLLDVGTGAGFPGVPLAIAVPECRVFLLDAARKKCFFLERAVREVGLANVTVVCGRAEELGRKLEYREKFDWVVARAVARLGELVEYTLPFVRVGGWFVAYKGVEGREEIEEAGQAVVLLGGRVEGVEEYLLPWGWGARELVFIRKVASTGEEFPRRPGLARRRPLWGKKEFLGRC